MEDLTNRRTVKTGGWAFARGWVLAWDNMVGVAPGQNLLRWWEEFHLAKKNPKKAIIVSAHNNADAMRICFGLRPLLSVWALPVMFAILAWRHCLVRYLRCIKIKAWLDDFSYHWEDITEVCYWSAEARHGFLASFTSTINALRTSSLTLSSCCSWPIIEFSSCFIHDFLPSQLWSGVLNRCNFSSSVAIGTTYDLSSWVRIVYFFQFSTYTTIDIIPHGLATWTLQFIEEMAAHAQAVDSRPFLSGAPSLCWKNSSLVCQKR